MSSSFPDGVPSLPADPGTPSITKLIVAAAHRLAFCAAIVLPFLHLPLLLAGLETQSQLLAFLILLTSNVISLVAGHPDHLG